MGGQAGQAPGPVGPDEVPPQLQGQGPQCGGAAERAEGRGAHVGQDAGHERLLGNKQPTQ